MIFKIKNEDIDIQISFRCDVLFENMMDKSFEGKNVTEWLSYFYASYLVALGKNPENILEFDEFINELDQDRTMLLEFTQFYNEQMKRATKLRPRVEEKN